MYACGQSIRLSIGRSVKFMCRDTRRLRETAPRGTPASCDSTAARRSGVGVMPTANVMYGAERAVLPRGPGDRAAELTGLRREQGGSRFAGRGVDEGVDFLRRQVAEQHAVAVAGGVVGIHVPMTERDHRDGGKRVDVRPESVERRVGAVSLVAEVHGLDHDERPSAEELGDLRERWDIEHPAPTEMISSGCSC